MQLVLGYTPLEVGLAFLPANLIMGAFSLGLSAKLVMRFGIKLPLSVGLFVAAVGWRSSCGRRSTATSSPTCCPSMILLGLGAGTAFNPVLLAAMSDVDPSEAGLASGVVNTSFMMGGAVGLAVLASLAQSRTDSLRASGDGALTALTGGYHAAFVLGVAVRLGRFRARRAPAEPGAAVLGRAHEGAPAGQAAHRGGVGAPM